MIVNSNPDVTNNEESFSQRAQELKDLEEQQANDNKLAKQTPFKNWYQFNKEYTSSMLWLVRANPKAYEILLFLLDQMDNYNAVLCSYKVIHEALNISTVTIARSIKVLKEHNFINVYKTGTSNIYTVNKLIAWSSWGKNYKYCKFDSNIIISKSEQEELNANLPNFQDLKATQQKVIHTSDE